MDSQNLTPSVEESQDHTMQRRPCFDCYEFIESRRPSVKWHRVFDIKLVNTELLLVALLLYWLTF